jgi:hypothetical protein
MRSQGSGAVVIVLQSDSYNFTVMVSQSSAYGVTRSRGSKGRFSQLLPQMVLY